MACRHTSFLFLHLIFYQANFLPDTIYGKVEKLVAEMEPVLFFFSHKKVEKRQIKKGRMANTPMSGTNDTAERTG